jgi:hypothetical protein
MRIDFLWDWFDFGIMFRVFKNAKYGEHYISIDIQIAWLNLWIQIFKKEKGL